MIPLNLTESFVNDELRRILDVIGVVNDDLFNLTPVPMLPVKSIYFIADTTGFDTPVMQVVWTPRNNI